MNKSELVEELSMRMALHPKKTESLVNSILNSMINSMKGKKRVEIRGFGSFVMRDYNPYTGRNPKSGEKIQVKTKTMPFFKSGKDMRERVNGKIS
jgi:integration host factor subunit beta